MFIPFASLLVIFLVFCVFLPRLYLASFYLSFLVCVFSFIPIYVNKEASGVEFADKTQWSMTTLKFCTVFVALRCYMKM